ncbi:MAG: transglutaminase family protein [Undibacterium curvum]|uniref:transglutaminase family protein n=1 Tax=Undibacterium curvum TaxID=2762294 RepID=UPI003BE00B83
MQLAIQHRTTYHYSSPSGYTIQQLRLRPRLEAQQKILHWEINSPGKLQAFQDAYHNLSELLVVTGAHTDINILAQGVVEVSAPFQGRIADQAELSPLIFTVPSRLTASSEHLLDFARSNLQPERCDTQQALQLASAIQRTVSYLSGSTIVTSTASEALTQGSGVCQDHAHIFLACCHVQGIPARYVSGYIDPESSDHAESHAWVDVWVEQHDYAGWVSIDVTHARLMNDAYCRLAIGRDYESASPVRGVRRGGGNESLSVSVSVQTQATV